MHRATATRRYEADESHQFNHFRTGNLETLRGPLGMPPKEENEGEPGEDFSRIRAALCKLHEDFYSANLMSVAILGRESLEELEMMVATGGRFEKVRIVFDMREWWGGERKAGGRQVCEGEGNDFKFLNMF
jgi:secreted Zn-dependent insulinase-like peptidase